MQQRIKNVFLENMRSVKKIVSLLHELIMIIIIIIIIIIIMMMI